MTQTSVKRIDVNRRGFLGTIFSAGALVLSAPLLGDGEAFGAEVSPGKSQWRPSVYLGVQPDGTVIIVAHRSEMGTGIRTALPMVAADELDVEWSKVKIEQALGDKKYGDQNTDGSNSIRSFYDPLRTAGATAKAMLIAAAAAKWSVPATECKAANGFVTHNGSKKAGYGELVALASQQPVPKPETLKFKASSEYRYIGKGVPITDLDDLVSGHGVFGMDAKMPGMVYASIEHPPVVGGVVKSVDDSEALKVRGVKQTVQIEKYKGPYQFQPLGGVAVIADNTWAAMQGRKKLKVDWDLGANANYSSDTYRKQLEAPSASRAKWRATSAMSTKSSQAEQRHSRLVITRRIWRMLRWNHLPRLPSTKTAKLNSGRRRRIRRPCRTPFPRCSASSRRTWPAT